jgi:hypothetical protein
MKKLAKAFGLVADLTPGAVLVITGLCVVVGSLTGVLWY